MKDRDAQNVPDQANIVVIGGGIVGCSVAYHLAERGEQDVLVLERKALGCGTTWHSHGLIGLIRSSPNMTSLVLETNKVLRKIEAETGMSTGFKQNGALILATDEDHLLTLRRIVSSLKSTGLELSEISRNEAARIWPAARMDDVISAFSMPAEGQVNPLDALQVYVRAARNLGVRILEDTQALCIESDGERVTGVRTPGGLIKADRVVVSAGLWSWEMGRASGVKIPAMAVEQSYIVTESMEELEPGLPILRDFQHGVNAREDARQLTIGATASPEKPWGYNGISEDFAFEELPGNWEHFERVFDNILHRIPAMEGVGVRKLLTGPEAITPDSRYYLGPAPGMKGCIVATGMSGVGVGSSGGIGREIATWVCDGSPSLDLWDVDIRRAMPFEINKHYLFDKVAETGGALFDISHPDYQSTAARNARLSPLHNRMADSGAHFEVRAGWEIPSRFATQPVVGQPDWLSALLAEHQALTTGPGIADLSAHAKLVVEVTDGGVALRELCRSELPAGPGLQETVEFKSAAGGTEFATDILCLSKTRYLLLLAPLDATRAMALLERSGNIVFDATSGFAVLWLGGHGGEDLLHMLTGEELPEAGAFTELDFGYARATVMGQNYVSAGYQIIIPTEFACGAYDSVLTAAPNIAHIGRRAFQCLALEAGYLHREVHFDSSPGGIATEPLRLVLDEPNVLLFGGEPIWIGNHIAGRVVHAGYSATRRAAIGQGYVAPFAPSEPLSIEVAMRRVKARPIMEKDKALSR